jgi:hypothetical protein
MARGDGGQLAELSAGVRGAAAVVDHVAPISLGRLILAGMVAGGVQYGWALQLSLLTPYVQVYTYIRRVPMPFMHAACIHACTYEVYHTNNILLIKKLSVYT